MTSMNGPSGRDSASGKHARGDAAPDQPPRAQFLTVAEVASLMRVSKMTVLRLIGSGSIVASQVCKGAPWAIPRAQLEGLDPRSALEQD